MTPFLRKLLGLNWLLLATMLALAIFGVVAIYSATYMRGDSVAADFWRKQANWVAVGFLAFMVTSLIDYRWIRWGALMQPDLGEVIIWVPVLLALLFVGGLPLRYLICIILIGLAFIPIAINLGLKPYQQQRITAFTHPDIDKQGAAWAINQSLIAIGSGGWSGKGFRAPNTQIELGFLPATAVHNDYIFSAIGEQWGFVGGMFLIGAFSLLLLTCLFVAFVAGDQLGLLLAVGVTALIFTHIFQNMGMTISMLPITGVPLPLISYSGSFVLMIMFGLGLVNSVWVHRHAVP